MSRNSKGAKRTAGVGGYGRPGPAMTEPKHGKGRRSKYNTAGRSGFDIDKERR